MMAELLPMVDGGLTGGLSMRSCILRSQQSKRNALHRAVVAQIVELGNKRATIEKLTGYGALTELSRQRGSEPELAEALRVNKPDSPETAQRSHIGA
jgi:hypothetical protein